MTCSPNREIESGEDGSVAAGIAERDVTECDLVVREIGRRLVANSKAAERGHGWSQPPDSRDRRRRSVQCPVEAAERDEANAERYLGVHNEAVER